ncbi:MAG: hypothetical protein WBD00_07385 [Candidatus Omnitrophota bacterium]
MGRKNFYVVVTILIMALTVSGCAELKDKFVPKKKKKEESVMRYKAVRAYDVKPNMELYTKRYVFWKNWHRETLKVLRDKNQKKVVVSVEQEISNLMDMKRMLVDEKAQELQGYINQMIEVETRIKKQKITQGNRVRIEKNLESAGKGIKRNFSYNKMRGYIRDDWGSRD